jgi:hypothetical protein
MVDEARLALRNVRVNRRSAHVYVYDDRIVVTTDEGERVIPMAQLERIATRRNWRGRPRLILALSSGELTEIRRLDAQSTWVAHRTIIDIARRFH